MLPAVRRGSFARFGNWEFDSSTGELFKGHTRVRLQEQPCLILATLVKRPGELVVREELYRLLWGQDTHVDYDHALNMAVAKIRRVLNDSPDKPRFIETIPKRGYRFIAAVEVISPGIDAPAALLTAPIAVPDPSGSLAQAPASVAVVEPEPVNSQPSFRKAHLWYGLAALAILLILVSAWQFGRSDSQSGPAPGPAARFTLELPSLSGRGDGRVTISPDGRHLVYVSGREDSRLWLRAIDKIAPVVLQGTEAARKPFWSPDSQTIVFATDYELRKVSVHGGPVTRICDLPNGNYGGGTWDPWNDTIVFSGGHPASLFQASPSGGEPKPFGKTLSTEKGKLNLSPRFLPKATGRRALLVQVGDEQDWDIVVLDIDKNQSHVLTAGMFPEYSPGPYVVYQTEMDRGGLWALPFSLSTLRPTGAASPALAGAVDPSVDGFGTLAASEAPPEPVMSLVLRDRNGNPVGVAGRQQPRMVNPATSPDGRYVAVLGRQGGVSEIWLHESDRPFLLRLSALAGHFDDPIWAPSSEQLIFRRAHHDAFELYRRSIDPGKPPVRISSSKNLEIPADWSRDGKHLLVTVNEPRDRHDIWFFLLSPAGDPVERHKFLSSPADEIQPTLSPDGRWLAYCSDATGAYEVYVKPFPSGDGVLQISSESGCQPRWSNHGEELFYVRKDTLMAAPFRSTPGKAAVGAPKKLFQSTELAAESSDDRQYDIAPRGRGFFVAERASSSLRKQSLIVIQRWAGLH